MVKRIRRIEGEHMETDDDGLPEDIRKDLEEALDLLCKVLADDVIEQAKGGPIGPSNDVSGIPG